jgi:hypothetical protein
MVQEFIAKDKGKRVAFERKLVCITAYSDR